MRTEIFIRLLLVSFYGIVEDGLIVPARGGSSGLGVLGHITREGKMMGNVLGNMEGTRISLLGLMALIHK